MNTSIHPPGEKNREARCAAAGIAAAAAAVVMPILAVAGIITGIVWVLSNHGETTGHIIQATLAGTVASLFSGGAAWLAAMIAWEFIGEPVMRSCQKKCGITPGGRDSPAEPVPVIRSPAVAITAATGAALGIMCAMVLMGMMRDHGWDQIYITGLSGTIIGMIAGTPTGTVIAVRMIRNQRDGHQTEQGVR